LITGGAGLIGSHIADRLVAEGINEIVVFDNLSRGRRENLESASASGRVVFVNGDIRDKNAIFRAMDGIDIVFQEAAIRITQCAESPRLAHDVLATGMLNLLEAAVASGVKRFVSASSASIYGQAERFPTNEKHHPYGNRTVYGAAKMYNEGLLRSFYEMYGLNYVALRYFNVYGPRMDAFGVYTEVMIRWMERLANGQPCLIYGDGSQTMDFIYVDDIARANFLAATSDLTDEVLNIGTGTETSLTELALLLGRVMGIERAPQYGPARKATPVFKQCADTAKARCCIGFEASISLEEGLRELVRWWSDVTHTAVSGLARSELTASGGVSPVS
jgi:nucleoside-diphosphate-sugar epimerase